MLLGSPSIRKVCAWYIFMCMANQLCAQSTSADSIYCNFNGGGQFPEQSRLDENYDLAEKDMLNEILADIVSEYGHGNESYMIRGIAQAGFAVAHKQNVNDSRQQMITIDKAHYASFFTRQDSQRAMFMFIIAHEFDHHYQKDLDDLSFIRFVRYRNELLSDFFAGQVIARLTHFGSDFFEIVLRRILHQSEPTDFHPAVEYRISIAKAGWMYEKTKQAQRKIKSSNQKIEKLSSHNTYFTVYKEKYDNGPAIVMGELARKRNRKVNGHGIIVFADGSRYIGEMSQGEAAGIGLYFNIGVDASTKILAHKKKRYKVIYMGDMLNDLPHGEGYSLEANGTEYTGFFQAGKYHGKGKLYDRVQKYSYEGSWREGKKHGQGKECFGENSCRCAIYHHGEKIRKFDCDE